MDPAMKNLIQKLCNAEPAQRLKFDEIDLDSVMSGDTKFKKNLGKSFQR